MKEKRYIAIGHWTEKNDITCVCERSTSIKAFRGTLRVNEFVPYVIFTEDKFWELKYMNNDEIWNMIKRMTSNYRVWNIIEEYIEQCLDIMERKYNKV